VRVFFSAGDPGGVIERAREVLGRVLERVASWPAEDVWPGLLPEWFVERCAPEPVSFDAAAWMQRWQAMSPQERIEVSQGPWKLSSWLAWFDLSDEGQGRDRSWWWDAGIEGESGRGWIEVATTGWPFGTGSLYWLIEACGGVDPHY
jgi:hypothetical protein